MVVYSCGLAISSKQEMAADSRAFLREPGLGPPQLVGYSITTCIPAGLDSAKGFSSSEENFS